MAPRRRGSGQALKPSVSEAEELFRMLKDTAKHLLLNIEDLTVTWLRIRAEFSMTHPVTAETFTLAEFAKELTNIVAEGDEDD